jgi:hypothetical protein
LGKVAAEVAGMPMKSMTYVLETSVEVAGLLGKLLATGPKTSCRMYKAPAALYRHWCFLFFRAAATSMFSLREVAGEVAVEFWWLRRGNFYRIIRCRSN